MFKEHALSARNGVSATVSFMDWLKFNCIGFLCFIPFIGGIAAIVIYLIIGFNRETAPSMSNCIKASLLFAAISIGISLFLILLFGVSIFAGLAGYAG